MVKCMKGQEIISTQRQFNKDIKYTKNKIINMKIGKLKKGMCQCVIELNNEVVK